MGNVYTLPYRDALGTGNRPYLSIELTGPTGASGVLWGLLDSGADQSCLPAGFAPLMGYTAADLEAQQAQQVGGTVDIQVALKPSHAHIVGLEAIRFEIWPSFVAGSATPLWGRRDLFQTFIVAFDEVAQNFTLITRDTDVPS